MCGRTDDWEAHHVVEAQYLKKNHHAVYIRKNALRVCSRFSKNDCHGKHSRGFRKIKLKELTEDNIDYALALLGPQKGAAYLRRHYAGSDPRLELALEEYAEGR